MKLKPFYFLAVLLFATTACTAQIELLAATKGNTGHRGIIPRDENGNHIEQPKGKDYYTITLKSKQKCTVELLNLTIKTDDGQTIVLTPAFTDGNRKKNKRAADQIFYVRAEREDNTNTSKQILKGEGLLKMKINGKVKTLPIENFMLVLPQ
jgi:hypothetical protein